MTEHDLNVLFERNLISSSLQTIFQQMLVPPQAGEQQQLNEDAWQVISAVDQQRLKRIPQVENFCKEIINNINSITVDTNLLYLHDAELLKDIVSRPINSAQTLLNYLAQRVEKGLRLPMKIPRTPDFRTFNGILSPLVLSTLDHGSIGRTLLFKGATYLIGVESNFSQYEKARYKRLETTIFYFPQRPQEGKAQMNFQNFNVQPPEEDPLDSLNVYESSDPQLL